LHCQSLSRFSDRARRERLSPELPSRTGNTIGNTTSALDTDIGILLPPWEVASTSTSGLTPGQTPDIAYRQTVSRLPTSGLRQPYQTRRRLLLGDTSPTALDNYIAQPEVASRHPDIALIVATHLPYEPDIYRPTSEPDDTLYFHITGSRAFTPVHEDPRPTMGNGVSSDQGNLPSYGKRDVRRAADRKQHDWSELAVAPETNSLLATANSYIYTHSSFKVICLCVIRKPLRAFIS